MHRAGSAFMLMLVGLAVLAAGSAQGAPGTLDQSFGNGGKVVTSFGSNYDSANAVAIQPNGKIVAAGVTDVLNTSAFALARYKRNGTLDPGFGTGGRVKTSFGADAGASAVTLQPDGKIVAAGGADGDFALARYNANGVLDPTFGSGGKVATAIGTGSYSEGLALVFQPDGKIVVGGGTAPSGFADYDFALVRYTADGSLDPSFGTGGVVTTAFSGNASFVWALALQPDGRIVAAGQRFTYASESLDLNGFALARYKSDGSIDAGFGSGGRVTTQIEGGGFASSVVVQPGGKIVAGGGTSRGHIGEQTLPGDFALVRYGPDGAIDTTFGEDGVAQTPFGSDNDFAADIALEADGGIVAAGASLKRMHYEFALARYTERGALDRNFGRAGTLRTAFGGQYEAASAIALQPNGKIVAAGDSFDSVSEGREFALARYLVGPSPCRVPSVTGKPLAAARQALVRSYCRAGTVKRAFSARVKAGRVISQRPGAGAIRPEGTRVSLVASKGKRPPH